MIRLGVLSVIMMVTALFHGCGSTPSVETEYILVDSITQDTIPLKEGSRNCGKIKVLTISRLFGEAIIRSHKGDSVTSLFV